MIKELMKSLLYRQYQMRFRAHLRGWSFISNNCIGGTLSKLVGDPYNSPTAGLWFTANGYRDLCAGFPMIVHEPITRDEALAERYGYPVGDMAGIKVMFQHYETFDDAVTAWRRRAERINYDNLLFVCAARDEFDDTHLVHFRALPHRRLLLTSSIGIAEPFAVPPPPSYRVEDLHSWRPLARTLPSKQLRSIARQQPLGHGQ